MYKKKSCLSVLSFIAVLIGIGCGSDNSSKGASPEGATLVSSNKERLTLDELSDAEVAKLSKDNAAFAFKLYDTLIETEKDNLFFSPHSISIALGMTYAGARAETASQMKETLSFSLEDDKLHAAFNALDQDLARRPTQAEELDVKPFALNIVNQAWGQKEHSFLDSYLDVLALHYGAGLYLMDFVGETEASRMAINDWVADETEERIVDLLPEGSIEPSTRLVLTNAVYFKASWKVPFQEGATTDGEFHMAEDWSILVPTMHQSVEALYAENDSLQAVELPYDGDLASMIVVFPKAEKHNDVNEHLGEHVSAALDILDGTEQQLALVNLSLPKFAFESPLGLKQPLINMGMPLAFGEGGAADFSGIDSTTNLVIDDVLHKAFVAVDEAGTEAAAATAVVVGEVSDPAVQVDMVVDRAFFFIIRDKATKAILFVGRVTNPTAT